MQVRLWAGACNRVLDSLRAAADPTNTDPSSGACDPLIAPLAIQDCRDNVRASLESWIEQIELGFEQCVAAAVGNRDPDKPYTDPAAPFGADKKLSFVDWGCSHDDWGCLHDAELRPFCEIDGYTEGGSCSMAGNQVDPAGQGGLDETGAEGDEGGSDGGGLAPFGDVDRLVSCVGTDCVVAPELLESVQLEFQVFHEEGVELVMADAGLRITGLHRGEHATALLDAFGVREGDVIAAVDGIALTSWASVVEVVATLEHARAWAVMLERPTGSGLVALDYSIKLGDVEAAQAERGPSGGDSSGASCACQASRGSAGPLGAWSLLLGLAAWASRRLGSKRSRDAGALVDP